MTTEEKRQYIKAVTGPMLSNMAPSSETAAKAKLAIDRGDDSYIESIWEEFFRTCWETAEQSNTHPNLWQATAPKHS